jgi:hypothetical protein
VAGRLLVPFVHMSGLHAADMHNLDLEEAFWLQKVRRRLCAQSEWCPARTSPTPLLFPIEHQCVRYAVTRLLDGHRQRV